MFPSVWSGQLVFSSLRAHSEQKSSACGSCEHLIAYIHSCTSHSTISIVHLLGARDSIQFTHIDMTPDLLELSD